VQLVPREPQDASQTSRPLSRDPCCVRRKNALAGEYLRCEEGEVVDPIYVDGKQRASLYTVGLKARGRIGHHQLFIDPKLISGAAMCGDAQDLVPSIGVFGDAPGRPTVLQQIDDVGAGCPQIEDHAVRSEARTVMTRITCYSRRPTQGPLTFVFFLRDARILSTKLG
jgi:hypothetical protein